MSRKSRPLGKLFRLRRSRLDAEGDCLVLLPTGFRNVLLDAASSRMLWEATWIEDDETRAKLTDAEWQQIESGIERLVDCVEIVNNITVTNDSSCGSCGGGGGDDWEFNCAPDGGGTLYIPPEDAPDPEDEPQIFERTPDGQIPQVAQDAGYDDVNTWDEDMCYVAHLIPIAIARQLRAIEEASDRLTQLGVILTFLAPLVPQFKAGLTIVQTLIEMGQAVGALLAIEEGADALRDMADDLEAQQGAYACLIYANRRYVPAAHSEFVQELITRSATLAYDGTVQDLVADVVTKLAPIRWIWGEGLTAAVLEQFAPIDTSPDCSGCGGATISNQYFVGGTAGDFNHAPGFTGGGTPYRWDGAQWVTRTGQPAPSYAPDFDLGANGIIKVPFLHGQTKNHIQGPIDVSGSAGNDVFVVQGWPQSVFDGVRVELVIDGVKVRDFDDGRPPYNDGSSQWSFDLPAALDGTETVSVRIAGNNAIISNAFFAV